MALHGRAAVMGRHIYQFFSQKVFFQFRNEYSEIFQIKSETVFVAIFHSNIYFLHANENLCKKKGISW